MIYTHDNRLLMKIKEVAELFKCSQPYLHLILDRYNIPQIKYKNRGKYLEINKDFTSEIRDFITRKNNKKTKEISKILDILELSL